MANVETRMGIDDTLYFLWGDPKKSIVILSGKIFKVNVHRGNKVDYYYDQLKVEVAKIPVTKMEFGDFGMAHESALNPHPFRVEVGMINMYPTFTSKEMVKKYLRKLGAI